MKKSNNMSVFLHNHLRLLGTFATLMDAADNSILCYRYHIGKSG